MRLAMGRSGRIQRILPLIFLVVISFVCAQAGPQGDEYDNYDSYDYDPEYDEGECLHFSFFLISFHSPLQTIYDNYLSHMQSSSPILSYLTLSSSFQSCLVLSSLV